MKYIVWKLGSMEHKIFPTDSAISKLSEILLANLKNGDVQHIIWGPDLEILQTEEFGPDDKHILTYQDKNGETVTIPLKREEIDVTVAEKDA